MINIDRVKGRVKSSMYRKINELIDKHPDEMSKMSLRASKCAD